MRLALLAPVALSLCGCHSYSDFELPSPASAGPKAWVSRPATGNPMIVPGDTWDSSDTLNPSLVRFKGELWNLYSAFDGKTWRTGAAVEQNGVWRKLGTILSPEAWEGGYIAANGSALTVGDEIRYWYEAGEPLQITLARSRDGHAWTKHGSPVLGTGPRGSFDESAVADPYVIQGNGAYFMFYLGQDRARRQRLGVARSTDGTHWEKLRSNPILDLGTAGEFDETGLGEPAVWTSGGKWWMLYTGRDRSERRKLALAESSDGVHWSRSKNFAPIGGGEAWNSEVVCDPHVELLSNGTLRVWYGGGDQPKPAEGLHGAIGVLDLAPR